MVHKKAKNKHISPAESVKVVVRLRGLKAHELNNVKGGKFSITSIGSRSWKVKDRHTCVQTTNTGESLPKKIGRTHFSYDKVFDEYASTREVYEDAGRQLVKRFVEGISGSLLVYGQTSAGKTHTMQGQGSIKEGSARKEGVIHMTVQDIFRELSNHQSSAFLIRVSVIEVYNEEIRDLLKDSRDNKVTTRYDSKMGLSIDSAEEFVTDYSSMIDFFSVADRNRVVKRVGENERSSRSHTRYKITLEKRDIGVIGEHEEGTVQISTLNLIDLAGSDTVRGGKNLLDETQKEGSNINKSLLALSHVMADLGRSRKGFINYRDSNLTKVLQRDLKSHCNLSIICCISPSGLYTEQTRKTLEFGKFASVVKIRPMVNNVADDRSLIIKSLRELETLRSTPNYDNSKFDKIKVQWEKIEDSMLVGAEIATLLEVETPESEDTNSIGCQSENDESGFERDLLESCAERNTVNRQDANDESISILNEDSAISVDFSVSEMKILEMEEEWSSIKGGTNENKTFANNAELKESAGRYSDSNASRIPNEIQFLDDCVSDKSSSCAEECEEDSSLSLRSESLESVGASINICKDGKEHTSEGCMRVSVTLSTSPSSATPKSVTTDNNTEENNLIEEILDGCANYLHGTDHDMSGILSDSDGSTSYGMSKTNQNHIRYSSTQDIKNIYTEDRITHLLSYSEDSASDSGKKRATNGSIQRACSHESDETTTDSRRDFQKQSRFKQLLLEVSSEDFDDVNNTERLVILETSFAQLTAENDELRKQTAGCYEMEKIQTDTINNIRAEKKRLLQKIADLREENSRILEETSDAMQCKSDNGNLKIELDNLNSKHHKDITEYKVENSNLKNRITELEQENASLQTESYLVTKYKNESIDLKYQIAEMHSKKATLFKDLQAASHYKNENNDLKDQISVLLQENESLRTQAVKKYNNQNEYIKNRITSLQEDLDDAKNDGEFKDVVSQQSLKSLAMKLDDRNEEVSQLSGKIRELETLLRDARISPSSTKFMRSDGNESERNMSLSVAEHTFSIESKESSELSILSHKVSENAQSIAEGSIDNSTGGSMGASSENVSLEADNVSEEYSNHSHECIDYTNVPTLEENLMAADTRIGKSVFLFDESVDRGDQSHTENDLPTGNFIIDKENVVIERIQPSKDFTDVYEQNYIRQETFLQENDEKLNEKCQSSDLTEDDPITDKENISFKRIESVEDAGIHEGKNMPGEERLLQQWENISFNFRKITANNFSAEVETFLP